MNDRRYLRVRTVAARYGVSGATIWRWAATVADFPRPVKIAKGTTAWLSDELDAYDARRIAESRARAA